MLWQGLFAQSNTRDTGPRGVFHVLLVRHEHHPEFLYCSSHLRVLFSMRARCRQVTPVTAGKSIATLICLRHTLRLIEPLADALEVPT